MENLTIRRKLREAGLYHWQLAEKMGVSEMTLVRKLRRELKEDERQRILKIIEELARENSNNENI